MGWEALFCLVVLAILFVGLVKNYPTDALLVGGVTLVALVGIINPEEALVGFSNQGMLTVAALYVVAAALRETGSIALAGSLVFGRVAGERGALLRMAAVVTPMSAFLNNTPIVAMFLPAVSDWCRRHKIAASRLLLPLSYLCMLGGTCTLIGTSTNLVVAGLMEETVRTTPADAQTLGPLGFFELGKLGLPYAVIGVMYLLLVSHRLLPERKDSVSSMTDAAREYLLNMQVQPDGRLAGRTVQEAGLRQLEGLYLIEIQRGGQLISPVQPDEILRGGDLLTFTGVVGTIAELENLSGLVPVGDDAYNSHAGIRRSQRLCEAVVSATSPAVGKTIRDADFRALYNAAVVAVHRGGTRLTGKVGSIVLRSGDTLLLQAGPHFVRANLNNPDFLLVSRLDGVRPIRHDKAWWALLLLAVLVGLLVSGVVPIVVAAFAAAGLMIATGCISMVDARRSIDWQTLITIAAAFGLSKGLQNSGLVAWVAEFFVSITADLGTYGILAGLYLMTSLFAGTVTNNAAAALVFPFAVAMGHQMGVSPRPLVMAVIFAASASFWTPLGYQTNLMVFGPGGYRLADYLRLGLPLNCLLLGTATVLIPMIWPF